MLPEIFDILRENIFKYIDDKKIKLRNTRIFVDTAWKLKHLRIELLRFGHSASTKSFPVTPPIDRSMYSFTLFIVANIPDYADCLQFIETVSDHFDKTPFLQLKIKEQEFEVGISSLELTINELNQFWMAQNQPHQPVLFYQARISEI